MNWPRPKLMYAIMALDYGDGKTRLHAVDSTRRMARRHVETVRDSYCVKKRRARVWIEEFETNHLFAGTFERFGLF